MVMVIIGFSSMTVHIWHIGRQQMESLGQQQCRLGRALELLIFRFGLMGLTAIILVATGLLQVICFTE